MTEHNAREIGLRIRRQREALGYSRGWLVELSGISNSFLSGMEHSDWGFSVALLARLAHILGLSADYILFGTGQVANTSAITDMLSSLDRKYLPELRGLPGACLKTITIARR